MKKKRNVTLEKIHIHIPESAKSKLSTPCNESSFLQDSNWLNWNKKDKRKKKNAKHFVYLAPPQASTPSQGCAAVPPALWTSRTTRTSSCRQRRPPLPMICSRSPPESQRSIAVTPPHMISLLTLYYFSVLVNLCILTLYILSLHI